MFFSVVFDGAWYLTYEDDQILIVCVQGCEKGSQGDAVFEVVSLQRETERATGGRGRLASPTEEEEPEEGMDLSLCLPL